MKKKDVYVAGVGFTPMKVKCEDTFADLVYQAVSQALADCSLSIKDMDTVVDAGVDLLDGKGLSNTDILAAAGCYLKSEGKLEEDGLTALFYAEKRIKAGLSENVLVFGYSKSSCLDVHSYFNASFDPVLFRDLGFNEWVLLALQASAMKGNGFLSPDEVLDALRTNVKRNPFVASGERSDEVVVHPLREKDLPLYADGAVAVVLTGDKNRCPAPVKIASSWVSVDSGTLSLREPSGLSSFEVAVRRVLERAGMAPGDVDAWELSEPTPHHLIRMSEVAGICDPADLPQFIREGRVNPSGGALHSTVLVACGLYRLAFGSLYLRGDSLPFAPSVPVKRVCVHAYSGTGMQSNTVMLLEAAA